MSKVVLHILTQNCVVFYFLDTFASQMDGYWIHQGWHFFNPIWRVVIWNIFMGTLFSSCYSISRTLWWSILSEIVAGVSNGKTKICNRRCVSIKYTMVWVYLNMRRFNIRDVFLQFFKYFIIYTTLEVKLYYYEKTF